MSSRLNLPLVAVAIFLLVSCSTVVADTTYTYTGNSFDTFGGVGFTSANFITFSMKYSTPLADQAFNVAPLPLTWTYNDGLHQMSGTGNELPLFYLQVQSDVILQWLITYNQVGSFPNWSTQNYPSAQIDWYTGEDAAALVMNNPGSWSVSSSVPEPASLFLLSIGLIALPAWHRRK